MIKNDLMSYKGYLGSVHFDASAELFFGKVEFIRDLINFEASDAKNLIKSFHKAIDSYLEDCNIVGKAPDKPFKGSFNVRIEPELHKEISLYAMQHGDTLNGVVKKALSEFIKI